MGHVDICVTQNVPHNLRPCAFAHHMAAEPATTDTAPSPKPEPSPRVGHSSIVGPLGAVGWDHGANRASNDAAVSIVPPIIRTAGFPQYGWKVGLSGSAFPHVAQVKPAPGIPCPALGLPLPFVHSVPSSCAPLCVGTMDSVMHRHSRSWLLYPRGPRSGLGYSVPVHPRLFDLIRPTRRHIPISPHGDLYGMPSLCWCA
jgi:hypothetical protein